MRLGPSRSRPCDKARWPLLILSLTLAGCTVGPDYVRPPVIRPDGFKSGASSQPSPPIAPEWWRLYSDPELDRLVAIAAASNQGLRLAAARVDEARALARVAASFLAPTVSLDPTVSRSRFSGNRVNPATGQKALAVTVNDWVVPVDLTYEIDVWGRVRRSLASARAQAVASADDEAAVRLTVQTDVAQFYYTLRLLDEQSAILTRTVAAFQEQVRVLSVQVRTGLASAIVLSQADAQLQATLAQQRDTVRARADQEHALAVLCGQPASTFSVTVKPLEETTPPEVPAGLPTALLTRRPDVASAEQLVVAANAEIGVATADFFPRFALTASAGFESAAVQSLFNWQSRVLSIVGGLTQPVFQRGRLKANLDAAKARHRQAIAVYVNQVLVAYSDVEDALTDLHALAAMVADLRAAERASENYRRLAEVQYRNGLVDYLVVIDAERTLLANQLSLALTIRMEVAASIQLIKALGGGWTAGGVITPPETSIGLNEHCCALPFQPRAAFTVGARPDRA